MQDEKQTWPRTRRAARAEHEPGGADKAHALAAALLGAGDLNRAARAAALGERLLKLETALRRRQAKAAQAAGRRVAAAPAHAPPAPEPPRQAHAVRPALPYWPPPPRD